MASATVALHTFDRGSYRPEAPALVAALKTVGDVTWIDLGDGHDVEITFYIDRDPERLEALADQFAALADALLTLVSLSQKGDIS